jgi:tetratricopeptide (TPR) repeat protein
MDLLQRARELYSAGRMHDALEAAQAACDRAPKDAAAWALLGRISRYIGLPAASDEAFRRAAGLDAGVVVPFRVTGERFRALIEESRGASASAEVRIEALPAVDQVRAGLDPDALALGEPSGTIVLFQVSHENGCANEDALRSLIARSLGEA